MIYIAALLTVHNRCEQTLACLEKLYSQEIPDGVQLDVFMVDDGCMDGTAESVKQQFPKVQIIHADGSLYWNRGMHRAWEVAAAEREYDYYLWLNDDTGLVTNAVRSLLELSESRENNIIAIGATRSNARGGLTYGGRIGCYIPVCDGTPHEVEHFNGNIVLVPKAVYNILGNLDYYYSHSKGDFDYGIRAKKAGIRMFQCGEVLGVCEAHDKLSAWCDPEIPLRKRWQLMHLPNGMPPKETFHLEKQTNLLAAVFHTLTVYLRCVFPQLWVKLKKH